jgi:hypothetical protein
MGQEVAACHHLTHHQVSTNTEYSICFHISFNTEAFGPLDMENTEWCQFTMCTPRYYSVVEGLLWCPEDSILNCLH